MTRTASGDGSWPFGGDGADVPTEDDIGYVADDHLVGQTDLDAQNGEAEAGTSGLPV